jgi:hypothetical protein
VTLQQYTVEYSTNGAFWTFLGNIQNVSIRIGRQNLQDTFNPSTATIVARYPNGYASPITALVVGTYVRVKRVGASAFYPEVWTGVIRDVVVDYGIPYVSNVGNADYLTISAEGALAYAGRLQGDGYVVASDYADVQLEDVKDNSFVDFEWQTTGIVAPVLAASTVSGSYAEWANTLVNTIGASILDGGSTSTIVVRPREYNESLNVVFSDTANNANNQVYDTIKFDSLSEDYFTQVQVDTNTVGTVVVDEGTAPYRTLRLSSFSLNTGQATDLASYYLGIYATPQFGIAEISCLAEAQNTFALELGTAWWGLVGNRTSLSFRGTSYDLTILGASIEASPESARYTYYLADANLTPYLILNDPVFGRLDFNKLGW